MRLIKNVIQELSDRNLDVTVKQCKLAPCKEKGSCFYKLTMRVETGTHLTVKTCHFRKDGAMNQRSLIKTVCLNMEVQVHV